MSASRAFPNAYTDAPEQHPNLVLGSLQLLFWLFFHPAAWRNHVARIDPTLRPDFWIAELSQAQWKNPALRRFLVQVYLVLPLLLGFLIRLGLWGARQSGENIAGVVRFVAAGVVASGVAGVVAIVVAGIVAGGMVGVVAGSIAFGVAGNVVGNLVTQKKFHSLTRQTGGIVVGILLGGIAFSVAFGVGGSLGGIVALGMAHVMLDRAAYGVAALMADFIPVMVASVVTLGVAFSIACVLAVGLRTRQWRYSMTFVVAFGVTLVVTFILGGSVVHVVTFGALFGLSYAIAERVAGSWAGAIAGAISCSGFWLLSWTPISHAPLYTWFWGLIGLVGGLTLSLWRPILFYPFLAVLNTLLCRLDQQLTNRPSSFLRYHSAFWDEHQRLPLQGLDSHLVLVAKRHPAEGQAAIEYLSTSRQRWAAQAAQIELDACQLERCEDAFTVGQFHRNLAIGELEGPADALLRSFNQLSEDVEAALNQSSVDNQRLSLHAVDYRLDGLLRELSCSRDKYAVRFCPIAQRWRCIIDLHLAKLERRC